MATRLKYYNLFVKLTKWKVYNVFYIEQGNKRGVYETHGGTLQHLYQPYETCMSSCNLHFLHEAATVIFMGIFFQRNVS